ncbi:unnamed protein product [Adineta steineri]|uniref:RING-type domain-containing protein n=1 Tax=Adineta steineri TaxID=433720 RepID=A0A818RRU6_9BILA|nr:unnamed protein product [Adineta steineri]CAF3658250.1 unnamed protein product [Adineta steineri]
MASNKIDDLLQCPICLEVFYDPKVLDCQHTFCNNCLKVHLAASARMFSTTNSVECPICRRRTNLINNSIDSLPGNYIVRDIIERQYGTASPERPPGYTQQIRDRIQKLQNGEEKEKEKEEETDYMEYLKPAVAALAGVLGGLLLAKGVKKLSDNNKKHDGH